MKFVENKTLFRYLFVLIAAILAIGSLLVSNSLVKDLRYEEYAKIKIWAEATKELIRSDENVNLNLVMNILGSNKTIPVILHDEKDNYYTSINITLPEENEQGFLAQKSLLFKRRHPPIVIEGHNLRQNIYYDDSYTLKRLQYYPFIQIGVVGIFILISLLAVLTTKRLEQDRVWVGLTRETAHQLGTPISSLIAWIEYLRLKELDVSIVNDIEKDVNRLQVITDRFSKIGSKEVFEIKDIRFIVESTVNYLKTRISQRVSISIDFPIHPMLVKINEPLIGWVIENVTKNAVDAMGGSGSIEFKMTETDKLVQILIKDSGKGISKSNFKTVFNPGYTSKERGWGLGLSLAKRIIESYHDGRIYVLSSEVGIGTTFSIEFKKSKA